MMIVCASRYALALPLLLGASACLVEDGEAWDEKVGETDQASTTTNGMSLNGMSLNGMSLNGMSLNGMSLNGMSINGMSLNGMSLNGMSLNGMSINGMSINGTRLDGVASNGQSLTGTALVGARLNGIVSSGAALPMRIDAATTLPAPNADVWAYAVSYTPGDGTWTPLCGTSAGEPVLAVPLAGTWNYEVGAAGGSWTASNDSFTFACRGTALTKCVELGYKPWQTAGGVSLRDHHQACTRMLRADYCGNGQPGTLNGWKVNLYDQIGLQGDTESGAEWVFEARWTASGAICVDEYRALELVVSGDLPTCALDKIRTDCSAGGFASGTLIRSEYNSAGVVGLVQQIVNQNPGTPLADKVEDALASLEHGFAELAAARLDREQAVSYFIGASGDLEAAVKDRVLADGYGKGLLNRIAGVARHLATSAAAVCAPRSPGKTSPSKTYLTQGDALRAAGRYKDACNAYKSAVAQDAGGRSCAR
jgi:hypothetical protein